MHAGGAVIVMGVCTEPSGPMKAEKEASEAGSERSEFVVRYRGEGNTPRPLCFLAL